MFCVVVHPGLIWARQQTTYVVPVATHLFTFAAVIFTHCAATATFVWLFFGTYVKQFPGNTSFTPVVAEQTYNLTQNMPCPGLHTQHHLPFTNA